MHGYDNYRGRTSPKRKAAVVILLLVLLLAGLYLLASEFTEFDSDGNVKTTLPWHSEPEAPPAADPVDDELSEPVNIIYDAPEDPLQGKVRAVEFTVGDARQGNSRLAAKLGDGNVAALWLKRPDGLLRYRSDAAGAALCFTDGLTETEVKNFTAQDTYTLARISCLKDDAASMKDMAGRGLTQENGYIWYGAENQHYLDLAKTGTQDYLLSLIRELASLGFDEILLSDLAYPTDGNQSKIASSDDRTATVTKFLETAKDALKDEDTRLSLELPEATVLAGEDRQAGISLGEILPLISRLYVKTGQEESVRAAVEKIEAHVTVVAIGGKGENLYTEAK